jgi:hypothetical protein
LNVIYVEHHDGPEQSEVGRIDWLPGWYAICDDCEWTAGPCGTEAEAHAVADAHDLTMGEATWEELGRDQTSERPAEPGELCTCGRQAVVVCLGSVFGPPATAASPTAATRPGRARSAAAPRHTEGRCPDYRLRLDQP